MERINAWTTYTPQEEALLNQKCEQYKAFLDAGKTERECVTEAIRLAEQVGFECICKKDKLVPGDKVYINTMGKAIQLYIIGKEPMIKGVNIVGAHIDSPRMDLKQNPLYEDTDLVYFDTHYYGGIKKYQWVATPLALHGIVCKKDGTTVNIVVGEDENDPVFAISDLLIHLSKDQLEKKGRVVIEGEELNLIIGGRPSTCEDDKEKCKAAVMRLLQDKYAIEEEDFLSAEIEVVPAGKARDMGFDRSMILGYGHDDRVCAYASLDAILTINEIPQTTCCCILADKEEVGSVGATGMRARYFENAMAELMERTGEYTELNLRRALANCRMLSTDVSAGFDPNFAGAFEKKNSAFLGRGVCFNKYTGSGGKGGSNDANAEFMARLRKLFDDNKINYQTAELGKVDQGGGGTIAYICALYGMEVIDSGVAVLSMHAPYEIISKADLFEAMRAYRTFMLMA